MPDRISGQGPLGGLESCFRRAKTEKCLVLGVDTPLVPVEELQNLLKFAMEKADQPVTMLCHNGKEESRAKVIMNVTKIEDLTVESIKPLEPVSATSEPQQSMKELRLDEIEERLKQKMKSSDKIKNNENSSEVLKITSETLTMIRKVMDCIGRMENSLNAKMAEQADDNNKLDSDFDPLYAFRAQHDKLGED